MEGLALLEKGAHLGTLFGHPARGFASADAHFVTETAKAEAGMIVFWR